jgi:alkaline phosphatase D
MPLTSRFLRCAGLAAVFLAAACAPGIRGDGPDAARAAGVAGAGIDASGGVGVAGAGIDASGGAGGEGGPVGPRDSSQDRAGDGAAPETAPPRDATSTNDESPTVDAGDSVERIGFGSCNDLTRSQAFWARIVERNPQVFLFLGDNAYLDYGDTYAELNAVPGFKQLLAIAAPLAIWDDHDFGLNDGGAAFAGKDAFKKKFIDFWGPLGAVPMDSPRRTREGNYDATVVGPVGRRVQLIMLDNRYFKGTAPSGTVLGAAQWQWLSDQLSVPANLRIVMSGIEAVGSSTASEGWAQFPDEQQRLYDVIKASQAKGVVIVSGDKHYAEISRRDVGLGYPLYDFTSSSLTASNSYTPQDNLYRDTPTSATQNHNFGLMTIDWGPTAGPVNVQLVDADTGATLLTKDLSLAVLGAR